MRLVKYCLYLAIKGQGHHMGVTGDIRFDAAVLYKLKGYDSIIQLSYPLSFIDARFLLEKVSYKLGGHTFFPKHRNSLPTLSKTTLKMLNKMGCGEKHFINPIKNEHYNGISFPCKKDVNKAYDLIKGRLLFLDDIYGIISSRMPHLKEELNNILNLLSLDGKTRSIPAIAREGWHNIKCNRCEERDNISKIRCAYCGEIDYICNECLNMGISTGCGTLFATENNKDLISKRNDRAVNIHFDFTFSPAQERASSELNQYVKNSFNRDQYNRKRNKCDHKAPLEAQQESGECLVWAVCGAGKTEVTFHAIREALSNNGKVLFAIPRKDVVKELGPRIKTAFPHASSIMLFGGSGQKFEEADITIATTHQALRLYRMFDLVILDEVDAYPYSGSHMLPRIIKRAATKGGAYIYMTATPGKPMEHRLRKKDINVIKIPARYHGYPLPVPEIVKVRFRKGKGLHILPEYIVKYIYKTVVIENFQCFLFVPTVNLCERIGNSLKNYFKKNFLVDYSHSKDKNRTLKVERFLSGQTRLFITTSILERGVTVPRCNVIVLFADNNKIFDTGSLIQMAGRAGRKQEYPHGKILFAGQIITPDMKKAIKIIKDMNTEAKRLGYLKP